MRLRHAPRWRERWGCMFRVGYIGGGTPSSLTTPQLDRLLDRMSKSTFGALAEFTVEAGRPDTLDAQKLRMTHATIP